MGVPITTGGHLEVAAAKAARVHSLGGQDPTRRMKVVMRRKEAPLRFKEGARDKRPTEEVLVVGKGK